MILTHCHRAECAQRDEAINQDLTRMIGEAKVLRELLKECANLIATIDCESQDEHDCMVTLQEKIVGVL